MKLKTVILSFTLLTIITALAGLFLYYDSMKKFALNEDRIVSKSHMDNINTSISHMVSRYRRIALSLSLHKEMAMVLTDASQNNLEQANQILDLFNSSMETSACYLLNSKGITITSSNRKKKDSFVGKDYSFRPYFINSMKGTHAVYMASGITSGKRGIYFSSPVFSPDNKSIIGVSVIKEDVDKIENEILFNHYPTHVAHDDIVLIINEDAVVFISDRKEFLFKTLWKANDEQIKHIAASRQFGKGPWTWAGFKKTHGEKAVDLSDHSYNMMSSPIKDIPKWEIIHLNDSDALFKRVYLSFFKTAGVVFAVIFTIIGSLLVLLNYLANKAENELKLSEQKYRSVTDTVNEGIILQAASGEILTWNKGAEKIFGISAQDVIGKASQGADWQTIHEDGSKYDGAEHPSIKTLATGKPNENETMGVFRPNGELRWISINTNPLFQKNEDKPYAVAISFSDITDLKSEKESLRYERDLIERIMETSPAGITRVDADGQIVYSNLRAEEILGITQSDSFGRPYNDPVWQITDFYGRPFPVEKLPFNIVKQTGKSVFDIQHAIEWPDGRQVFLSINASPLFNPSHEFEGMVATIENITQKYKAEQNYQMIFREMLDGFALHEIICDGTGNPVDYRFLAVNPAFERLTGLSAHTITGKTVLEVLPGTEPHWIKKYGQVALTGVPAFFENFSKELDRHFQVTAFRPAKNQFACIIVDITDRKAMESRLMQAQKMESIGSLAGGIAHDFNNILFPIIGMAELLLEDLPTKSLEHGNVRQILKAGKRGGELVKQILAFSRQSEHKTMPIRVQHVLKEVLKLSRSTIPTDIEITSKIQPDCGLVLANATQIHQVAMNLITNAYHALESDGGRIDVRLEEVALNNDAIVKSPLKIGHYILFSVSDTGCGIKPEHLDKIFDPYFTTKEQGKGTGLGLSIVYGIIREYDGDIKVISNAGGTTFNIYLPLMEKKAETVIATEVETPETGTEKILLVDDEEPVAQIEKEMLERLGYQVSKRTSSTEALKAFQANPNKFDLVITDMTMPNMTGDKLAGELLLSRPDIPIIICTGYSERLNKELARDIGVKCFLMKPVVRSELARTVRDVLDKSDKSKSTV